MNDLAGINFSSRYEIQVLVRPEGSDAGSWQELDRGPGYFRIEPGLEVGIRIRQSDDLAIKEIFEEIRPCSNLIYMNLSENRNVSDNSLEGLAQFVHLNDLNLSSCDITDDIFPTLRKLSRLQQSQPEFLQPDLRYRSTISERSTPTDFSGPARLLPDHPRGVGETRSGGFNHP